LIPERGVSYYGVYDPVAAFRDFEKMKDDGLNAVLVAVSEFDYWFWKGAIGDVLAEAKRSGLSTYLDLWGWGKVFGGEPGSLFVQNNPGDLQVSSSGSSIPAACVNSGFRTFALEKLEAICREFPFDGLFLDEPHYNFDREAWGCYCERCRALFKETNGEELTGEITDKFLDWRENSMLRFLSDLVGVAKAQGKDVTICMLPFEGERRRLAGAPGWEQISLLEADVMATDPYWIAFGEPMEPFVVRHTRRVLETCASTGTRSQIWVQLFNVPAGREGEVAEGISLVEKIECEGKKVDSVFGWPYAAGRGSVLASDDPELVWKRFISALAP
jgi:hypothetical protein